MFGIPFSRPFTSPFGIPFLGGLGGSSPLPPFPNGSVGYYNPWDITNLGFSSANNVNLVVDQESTNDITQGTASANPLFIEHDTAVQYTASNQPSLVDTGGGVLAVGFDANNHHMPLSSDLLFNGDFTHVFDVDIINALTNSNTRTLMSEDSGVRSSVRTSPTQKSASFQFDNSTAFKFTGILWEDLRYKIEFKRHNNILTLIINGDLHPQSFDVTGYVLRLNGLSEFGKSIDGNIYKVQLFDSYIADTDNTTVPPFYELLPTVESCNTLAGNPVERWNATSHRGFKNVLRMTAGQFLQGLAPQTGSFSMLIECKISGDGGLFGSTGSTRYESGSGLTSVISDDATQYDFTNGTVTDTKQLFITYDETNLNVYQNACLSFTAPLDATGKAFDFTVLGDTALSAVMDINQSGVWDRVLTQEEIEYFSYQRDADTGEFVEPLQLEVCPVAPVIYPSTYRTHKQYVGLAIDMSVSAVSTSLVFSSTGASYGGMYALVQVTKASIDGNKLSVNWGTNYSFTLSQMQLYDGALEGDSALFVNGALPNTGALLISSNGSEGTNIKTVDVPDLSSYNDIVTLVLFCGDDWSDPVEFTVNSLQLLSQADALITEYDITSNVAQTGTDGDSKFGTLGQVV